MKWLDPKIWIPAGEIQDAFSGTILLAEQLAKRGIKTQLQADRFLKPATYKPASPFEFLQLEVAVHRIRKAVSNKERIGVWGDFDVDGQTSTALLVGGLRLLGADIAYHIPVRAEESHGIQVDYLKKFLEKGVRLLITCDTGITEFESIEYLSSSGIDAIISDHHTPGIELPRALAVINPRLLPENHTFSPLAGVGTAFQILRGLFEVEGKVKLANQFFDLVALGTIADQADLTGENRYYVKKGLVSINQNPRPAIKALLDVGGFKNQTFSESHIGFSLAPRMNATGRLADANRMVEFLNAGDSDFIHSTARELEDINARRKLTVDMVCASALEMLEKQPQLLQYPVIVLAKARWEGGVLGIAASRLVERYQKPAILLNISEDIASGSARSVQGINLIKAISENSSCLIRFGGHPMAAGLSVNVENLPFFSEGLSNSVAAQTKGLDLTQKLEIDAVLPLANLDARLLDELDQLAPFGPGNTPPLLVSRNLRIHDSSFIGKTKDHRKISIFDSRGEEEVALWWNSADRSLPSGPFDLAYYIRRDDYHPDQACVLEWVDFHDVSPEKIQLTTPKVRYKIQDHRLVQDCGFVMRLIGASKDLLIWAEGNQSAPEMAVNRTGLLRSKKLAILTPPPSLEVLLEALLIVDPEEVILCSSLPPDDSLDRFLRNLSGIIKYCLGHYKGKTSFPHLAGSLGQTEKTIKAGLEWWQARGEIIFTEMDGDIQIMRSANLSSAELPVRTALLKSLLEKTSAFRNFYRRADPHLLLQHSL